jgi:hypothetical protein
MVTEIMIIVITTSIMIIVMVIMTMVTVMLMMVIILYVRQLSDPLNWGSWGREPYTSGRVDRRRGCFIVHRENIQLLEIDFCRIKLL